MSIIKPFFIGILISCLSSLANSEGLSCIGMDGSGQTIHLIFDVDTATININGHILKISSGSKDGKKIWTTNYISDQGVLSKGILTHKKAGADDSTFLQVNAVTSDVIAKVPLACKRY